VKNFPGNPRPPANATPASSAADVRLLRCLDALLYGLIALAVLLLWPGAGRNLMNNLSLIVVLPALWLAWTALQLPPALPGQPKKWVTARRRLIGSAVLMSALQPGALWYQHVATSLYLACNAMLWVLVTLVFLFEFAKVVGLVAEYLEGDPESAAVKATLGMYFYLTGVPALAAALIIIQQTVESHSHTITRLRLELLFSDSATPDNGLSHGVALFYRFVVTGAALATIIFLCAILISLRFRLRRRVA
jgi:hypothetical protein